MVTRNIKSALTNQIFKQEMLHTYEQKSQSRDELVRGARRMIRQLTQEMAQSLCAAPEIEQKMEQLVGQLETVKGKKSYGYLPESVKKTVDEAVDKLEELLDNIVEMYCCPRQTQYVGKQPQTTKAIRLRLDKLTSQHVEYIFDVMSNTTQPIKNILAYLRTTILNAPTTMEHYYQAQGNWLTAQNRKK